MRKHLFSFIAAASLLFAGGGVTAFASPVDSTLYSWTGAQKADEKGGVVKGYSVTIASGTVTATESTSEINVSKNSKYVLQVSGSWAKLSGTADASTTYLKFTLDTPLQKGDIISVTGFRTATASNKYVTPAFVFNYGTTNDVLTSDDNFVNINSSPASDDVLTGSTPNTVQYEVPEAGDGATSFLLVRKTSATNLFVTSLKITGTRDPDAKSYAKTPTAELLPFDFTTHKYTLALSSKEANAEIHYSIDGTDKGVYSDAFEVANGNVISFYSVVEGEENSPSDSYTVSVPTFTDGKPYVAWVYQADYASTIGSYSLAKDPLYTALSSEYNVVPVSAASKSVSYKAASPTLVSANLVVISEAMTGNATFSNGLVELVGTVPVLSMKAFNYGNSDAATARWKWGIPANATEKTAIEPADGNYNLFKGATVENGQINLFDNPVFKNGTKTVPHIQTVTISGTDAPSSVPTLAKVGDAIAFHAADKYVLLSIACDDIEHANANAQTIIKNAAALLLAEGNDVTTAAEATKVGSVSFGTVGYATFSAAQATIIPEGVTAYTGELSESGKYLNLNEISGYIPANTGVILAGKEDADLNSTIYAIAAVEDNALSASVEATTVAANSVYTLAYDGEDVATVGLYKFAGTQVAANKAYLKIEAGASAPVVRFNFGQEDPELGNVSGINAVSIENRVDNVIYDLRGRRVQSLDRPGLYIMNGKKISVK